MFVIREAGGEGWGLASSLRNIWPLGADAMVPSSGLLYGRAGLGVLASVRAWVGLLWTGFQGDSVGLKGGGVCCGVLWERYVDGAVEGLGRWEQGGRL